jgi:hypothetical protein
MSENGSVATNCGLRHMPFSLLKIEVLIMSVKSAPTKMPPRKIIRTVVFGSLATALAVIFDHRRGIHCFPRLGILLGIFAFWCSLFANFNGPQESPI